MNVADKIKAGHYSNPTQYPKRADYATIEEWRDAVREWNGVQGQYYDQFRVDALVEVCLSLHPRADKIMAYAWEKGHSAGLHEVLSELNDVAELFL